MLFRCIVSLFFLFSAQLTFSSINDIDISHLVEKCGIAEFSSSCADECQNEKECSVSQCSCSSLFTQASTNILLLNRGINQKDSKWSFNLFYISQSLSPELRPPKISLV